ncbi:peptide-methionine (S)-S-oxide reductase [filamentous cyanobacterium CCP5]|nr:peptide-methionine (S)-S-oxide reductase [filamentous cyanobacterium CCP5]
MKAIKALLLSLCLLGVTVVAWDILPCYARADAAPTGVAANSPAEAVFAGGCFWCMEPPFDHLDGVIGTTSGYSGGDVADPNYYQVSSGTTGHLEAVKVTYDPQQVSYGELLEVFWHNIDPVDSNGQFCDKGSQYRSAIFVANQAQREAAERSRTALANQPRFGEVVTQILEAQPFYPAEEYHQDYYLKHPVRYKVYRFGCGRDQRLGELWGTQGD